MTVITWDEITFMQVKTAQSPYMPVARPAYVGHVMGPRDPDLHDSELESEIELLGEVLAAAAPATAHLTQDQIDAALGLTRPRGGTCPDPSPQPPALLLV